MESGPSKIAETLVHWLLPPACREEVLGDMRERHQSSAHYLMEASCTVPSVIFSRIRRTTDSVVALMEAVSLYTAFVVSARWLDQKLLFRGYGFAWLAAPTAIFVAAIILADSYSDPKKRWPLKPLLAPTLGVVLTFATGLIHRWALPVPVLALGDAIGMLIVSTLRVTFPPLTERPQAANMPTFWQKLELSLPSFSLKKVILPCLFLLAIIMFLLITHP